MFGHLPPARLIPEDLWLSGRDLEIASVIAQETEARRALELAELPPANPLPDQNRLLRGGLLGPALTPEEWERESVTSEAWDGFLRKGAVLSQCVARTGLDHVAVCQFALDRCRPANWETLFWYMQWIKEAISDKMPLAEVQAMLAQRSAEVTTAARKSLASKGGEGKGQKSAPARLFIVETWKKQAGQWHSKREFADCIVGTVKDKFGIDVRPSTISDEWLSPSRLSGK